MAKKYRLSSFATHLVLLLISIILCETASWAGDRISVNVTTSKGTLLSGIKVYAFTEAGSYTGKYAATDTNGTAAFDSSLIIAGNYKFRADYLGSQFWSQVVTLPDTLSVNLVIDEETAEVTVTTAAGASSAINVYLFSATGSYLGRYGTTDSNGKVSFELPVGKSFKLRADILGSQYWSDVTTIASGGTNTIAINAGGGVLQVTVDKAADSPLQGIKAYLFSASGSYLGRYQTADASGIVRFNVSQGSFKVRADYMGGQFWTAETSVTGDTSIELTIPHSDIAITVQGIYQGKLTPIDGVKTYLFSSSGSYLSQYGTTDSSGHVTFNLPEKAYKVRADYLGQQFWSDSFTWQNTEIDIPMADAEITVTGAGDLLEGVNVYVFSETGTYLTRYGKTDTNGMTTFRLPAGSYKFRADYLGNKYWSALRTLLADQVNPFPIATGGGTFVLTVLKGVDPLAGINTYLFSETGSYLSQYGTSDSAGQVSLKLPDGIYKFRVDYLGYQFWTGAYSIPTVFSGTLGIPHQDVTVTVQAAYLGMTEPIQGVKAYLFSPAGAYLTRYNTTDINGNVTFNLPQRSFKVRADYLGKQFLSNEFTWQNTTISIPYGMASVHVTKNSSNMPNIKVYLFSEVGSYLSRNNTTDGSGIAGFMIPSGSYKFRADEGSNRRYSDIAVMTANQTTVVNIDLSDLPVVRFSASPASIQEGGTSTLTWTTENAQTVSIDQGAGAVDLNGSVSVTPSETTTYTLTANGSGGTTTSTAIVTVIQPPADIDLGIDVDEQQGGGGLVGETIRVFDGNVIEARSDLSLSSFHRLGLTLEGYYNSRLTNSGTMGYGWTYTYDASLDPSFSIGSLEFLKIIDSTGRAHYFMEGNSGEYDGVFAEKTYVELESGEYVWHHLNGSEYGFSSTGRLSWMDDAQGNRLMLAYDGNNRLATVTDNSSGRVLTFYYNASALLDHVTGPVSAAVTDGVWVSYGYDTNNNLTSVAYADGSGFDYSYTDTNDIHNLTEKTNKADHLINTWEYDTSDRAISNFSRDGNGVDIVYTSETQINVTDAYEKEREYILIEAAGRKRVSAITDGIGGAGSFPYSDSDVISWIYDENMNPTELEYPGGTIDQYSNFDERGNPGTAKLALNTDVEREIYYTYHPDLNTPLTRTEGSVLGSGNKVTIWDYDSDYDTIPNENPTALVSRIVEKGYTKNESGSTVSYEYVTTYTYNSKGQVLSIDGPLSGTSDTTSFTYYPVTGDLLTISRPLVGATSFTGYDAAGQAGTIKDVNGKAKTYTYDGRGRVRGKANSADSSSSSVDYNTAGLPELETDEDGVTTEFEYDNAYGRLFKRYDHEGNYIEYSYDEQGNVTDKDYYNSSSSLTNSKGYLYQGSELPGMLYREISGDGTYTQYSYDLDGNVASVRDPNGNTTSYAYDSMNRLVRVTQPGSIATGYTYDGHGNLHTVIDAENHTTIYVYDDMARLVSSTSPDTGTVTYAYDEAGNPINKTDAKAISVDYSYDVLNRLISIDFPTDADITYRYDTGTNGIGQRTGMSDESGDYAFGYDSRGRLINKTSIIGGSTNELTRSYTPGGRVISMTYPTGRTINYNRSTCACKVDSITTTYSGTTTTLMQNLTYRPFGGASAMSNGAGGTVGSTYNASGKLTFSNPGATHERTYTYDNNGNLLALNAHSTPYYNRVYQYDALDRLIYAEGPWGEIDYSYDGVGNRLLETITDDVSSNTDNYAYTTGTNLLSSITGAATTNYTYDDNGNITGMGTKTLNYNQDNRLVNVVEGVSTLGEYTYNGLGQRIIKEANGTTTIFHYDFDGNIIGESSTNGTFNKEYIYRGNSRLAMVDVSTSAVYYYGNDQLGTPEILTDSTNTVVWEAVYKPFGEAEVNTHSTVVNNFRFPGQYYDAESGLHYNYHRYYDPSTGRYLSADPIGQLGGINLFAYAGNNPSNATDPLGLYKSPWYLSWVPGQHLYDLGMTALEEGRVGIAASYFAGMLTEQALTATSFGYGSAAKGASSVCEYSMASKSGANLLPAPHGYNPWVSEINSVVTKNNMTAYRVWGDEAGQVGAWLSPAKPSSALSAIRGLALPPGNSAKYVSEVLVPAGTRYQVGTAASAFGQPGGATQVLLLDRIPAGNFGAGAQLW